MVNRLMTAVLVSATLAVGASGEGAQQWGYGPQPRSGVCFFKDTNFRGDYFCARPGESVRDMPDGMNDKITSIKIFGGAEVIVYQDSKFEGRSARYNRDIKDLKREGWNDLISSFRVRGGSYSGGGGYRPGG